MAIEIEPRPMSWPEITFTLVVGALLGALGVMLLVPKIVCAGGDARVTWNQSTDCPSVTGWELLAAPITAAQPNPQPTAATFIVSIANQPPVVCGPAATTTAAVSGVGPMRFWMRAVFGSTAKSGESNPVDVTLPLARPAGLTVVVP